MEEKKVLFLLENNCVFPLKRRILGDLLAIKEQRIHWYRLSDLERIGGIFILLKEKACLV